MSWISGVYLALIACQWIWLSGITSGREPQWLLAVVFMAILAIPLPGILKTQSKSLVWGGFLVLLLFVVGVMEAWADPGVRIIALVQVALSCAYGYGLWTRGRNR